MTNAAKTFEPTIMQHLLLLCITKKCASIEISPLKNTTFLFSRSFGLQYKEIDKEPRVMKHTFSFLGFLRSRFYHMLSRGIDATVVTLGQPQQHATQHISCACMIHI